MCEKLGGGCLMLHLSEGVISRKFLIKYYESSFDHPITIQINLQLMLIFSIQLWFVPYWTQTYGILLSS